MQKRLRNSKTLIFGLTSAIGVATITSAATIVSLNQTIPQAIQPINRLAFDNISQIPNLDTSNDKMFKVKPTNINRYNFASVRKGATATPYGWIGVADDPVTGRDHEIALTNWSGEVLWRTDLKAFKSSPMGEYSKIQDIKYDAGIDKIVVLASNKQSGAFDTAKTNNEHDSHFYVINPKTGQPIGWNQWSSNDNKNLIIRARDTLEKYGAFSLKSSNLDDTNYRLKDLYSIDLVSALKLDRGIGSEDNAIIQYAPNLMQLYRNDQILTMQDVVDDYHNIAFNGIVYKKTDGYGIQWRFPNIRNLIGNQEPNGSKKWTINSRNDMKWSDSEPNDYVNLANTRILTSPFWTGEDEHRDVFFLHFFFATNDQKRTFHAMLQFRITSGKDFELMGSNMEQLQGRKTGSPALNIEIENNDWDDRQSFQTKEFVLKHPANTKINHNMFQPNIATFAFPYGYLKLTNLDSKEFRIPKYNVAQVVFGDNGMITNSHGSKHITSRVFNLGKDTGVEKDLSLNNAGYRWGRLVSVNPFDNSFVYLGTKPSEASANASKFGGWIVRSSASSTLTGFSINNIDSRKADVSQLWEGGFGFDPYIHPNKLNLYYNQKPNQENYGSPDNFKSNQLGMLGQFSQSNQSIATAKVQNADINANSYGAILFSRPDLAQWYPLTSFNFNNPINLLSTNQTLVQANQDLNALGKNWKPRKQDNVLALVSHEQKSTTLDNIRLIKSPKLTIKNERPEKQLRLNWTWDVTNVGDFNNQYKTIYGWSDANNKMRYWADVNINNPSYQIFNKFGNPNKSGVWAQKVKTWSGKINNLNLQTDAWDATKQSGITVNPSATTAKQLYGFVTNAQNVNGRTPLRVMAQLVAPSTNNQPNWFKQFKTNNPKYWQPAPLVGSTNEVPFNTLMSEFTTKLMQNINNKTDANQAAAALGLANFKINMFYQLDPNAARGAKIYGDDQRQIMFDNNNQAVIYQVYDQTTIYDQSATSFATLKDQGLVNPQIQANWSTVPQSKKLIYQANGSELKWPIVDSGQSFLPQNKEKIFQAEYDQSRSKLKIKAINANLDAWFKKTITTMNFTYGLKVVFEAKTAGSNQWQVINNNLMDSDYAANYDNQSKTFTLNTNQSSWKVLRIKLVPIGTQDVNGFVEWINTTDDKFTSQEVQLGADVIKFNRDWISQTALNANKTIDQLSANDFNTWLNTLRPQFEQANPTIQNLWSMLEVKYYFDNQTFTSADNLVAYLKQAANDPNRNDQGWWYLWVGTTGDTAGLKIDLSFHIKSQYQNDFALVDMQNNPITGEQTKTAINAKIKRNFDLKPYIDQLMQNSLVTQVNNQNQIIQIEMPNGTSGLYDNLDFNTINTKLNAVGIKFQFQAWQNNNWSGQWVDQLSQIKTFNPNNPQIKIRALVRNAVFTNSQAVYGQTILDTNSQGYVLNLQLPKLIDAPNDLAQKVQQLVQQHSVFSGNTKVLKIQNQAPFENAIYELIKNASGFQDNNFKQFLKIKYQVGNQSQWVDLQQLVSDLAQANSDLTSNQIDLKFVLEGIDQTHPQYTLSNALNNQIFNLVPDQNTQVKIYLHGTKWEHEINNIVAAGERTKINYNIPSDFNDLIQSVTTGVQLEWKFDDARDSQWKAYPQNPLPTNLVNDYPDYANVNAIKIQVSHLNSDQIYHYGPQQDQPPTRRVGTIDLSKLAQNVIVDPNWFDQHPLVNQTSDWSTINATTFTTWETTIKNLIQVNDVTKAKIKIEYNLVWPNQTSVANQNWTDANGIINQLNGAMTNYGDPLHNGIISFYNHQNTNTIQTKIVARFSKTSPNDLINFVDVNHQDLNDLQLQGVVDSSNIITTLDLSNYWTKIQTELTTVVVENPQLGTIKNQTINPPQVDQNQLLGGATFDQLDQALRQYQIKFIFNNQFGQNQNPNWVQNGAIDTYNPQDPRLQVAINNESSNLKIKLSTQSTIAPNDNNKNTNTFIKLQVPKLIRIEQSWFGQFINDHGFSGNTKYLETDATKVSQLLTTIKNNLAKINPDLKDAPLEIKFQLGSTALYDLATLKTKLAQISTDQNDNQIKMQLSLQPGTSKTDWILEGYATQQAENVFNGNSPLKIFLHDNGIWAALNQVQLSGDNQNLQWNFNNGLEVHPVSGLINKPNKQNALKVQYRLNPQDQWQDQQIHSFVAGQTTLQIQLTWANVNAEQNFVFEDAILNQPFATNQVNHNLNVPINVDLTKLKATIVLQSQWLNQIIATGDLIKLQLDETQLRQTLATNNVLVASEVDNLVVQYSIDNQNWMEKDQFMAFLVKNNGQESASRFILKREAIKTRFALKAGVDVNKYGWQIDGIKIQNFDQYQNHYKQLIDQSHNQQVNGIINLELVSDFVKTNFWIRGTNLKPRLEVKNKTNILNKFNPYQSENIFRILLATKQNPDGSYDWQNAITIWQNGNFISDLATTFKDLKNAAIKFEAFSPLTNDNNHYLVKSDATTSAKNDLIFDISDQIKVVTEIINPFSQAGKKLAIQTRENGKAKWRQNAGQFKIMVGNANWEPENQSANAFLQATNDISANEKTKLEFAYTIFKTKPDQTTIEQAKQSVDTWNAFTNPDDWSGDLKLKVGDYVMVALRVKKQFASGDQAFILQNNDHSFLIPINEKISDNSQPIAIRQPGRISGLLIDPESAKVQENVQLKATNPTLTNQLIDGWVQLDQIQIANDQDQASGLDLKLNLYNSFHLDSQTNQPIISASNALLVKRDQTNADRGAAYVDAQGQEIVDRDQQKVYLWIDRATKKPAKPLEQAKPTQSINLNQQNDGIYKFNLTNPNQATLFNLFKNQKVVIEYQAKVGLGDANTPDFELTKAFSQDIKDLVNPQIKFVLENPQNIIYQWANRNEFGDGIVQFEPVNTNDQIATNGAARVKTILKLARNLKNDAAHNQVISANNGLEAAQLIKQTVVDDFSNQLRFNISKIDKNANLTTIDDSANIYQLEDLQNGDQIRLSLKTTDEDLIYLDAPQDLIINVNGLATVAPDRAALRFLRVEQSGKIDGQGSFRVLVNDPNGPINNDQQILKGWKFLIRVWDRDLTKGIKINWTEDQSLITNLANGDRVEWKLVDSEKNPVTDAYYNTIAMQHDLANGKYNYAQVNYAKGQNDLQIVKNDIGNYPADENQYPKTSGFVISNLVAKEQVKPFNLTQLAFEKVIKTLNPTYYGQNGNGALRFNDQYMEGTWYVDLEGNLYQEPKYPDQDPTVGLQEITLINFFNNTTFYLQNPITNPAQVGFKFKANLTNTGNQLKNGDQVFAQFDVEGAGLAAIGSLSKAENEFNEPVLSSSLVTQLPDVNNLVESTDPLTALWIVLAILATLGIALVVWAIVNANKNSKLKVRNIKR